MSKQEIMEKQKNELVTGIDFFNDAGSGLEHITEDDRAIPFLKLLQTNSPECDESAPEYIKDAKAGQFINSVTKEILNTKIDIIPFHYKRVFNKWQDRSMGGGFKGAFDITHPDVINTKENSMGKKVLPNGDYFIDTRNFYVIAIINEIPTPMILGLSSTQVKKAKQWIAQMDMLKLKTADGKLYTPAMYSCVYTLESKTEKNDKGTWKGVVIERKGIIENQEIYQFARLMSQSAKENKIKAHEPVEEQMEIF